jgi:hypothetical protein
MLLTDRDRPLNVPAEALICRCGRSFARCLGFRPQPVLALHAVSRVIVQPTTGSVQESKRLLELTRPRCATWTNLATWYWMASLAEKDDIVFAG